MNVALLKPLVTLAPACTLFLASVVLVFRRPCGLSYSHSARDVWWGGVLTPISEAFHLFPWMQWGLENSVGYYLDFWSAVLGLMLFPVAYCLQALSKSHT